MYLFGRALARDTFFFFCLTDNEVVQKPHAKAGDVDAAVHKQPHFHGEGSCKTGAQRKADSALAPQQRASDGDVVETTDVVDHQDAAARAFHVLQKSQKKSVKEARFGRDRRGRKATRQDAQQQQQQQQYVNRGTRYAEGV